MMCQNADKKSLFLKWVLFVITTILGFELFIIFDVIHSWIGPLLWFYVVLPVVLIGIAMIGCPRSVWPTVKELPDKIAQTFAGIFLFLFALMILVFEWGGDAYNSTGTFFVGNGIFYLILLFIWQPHVFGRCHKWIKGVMMSLLLISLIYMAGMFLLVCVEDSFNKTDQNPPVVLKESLRHIDAFL